MNVAKEPKQPAPRATSARQATRWASIPAPVLGKQEWERQPPPHGAYILEQGDSQSTRQTRTVQEERVGRGAGHLRGDIGAEAAGSGTESREVSGEEQARRPRRREGAAGLASGRRAFPEALAEGGR